MAQLFPPDWAEMPIKVTYQNPGLEYDENMVCEDFLHMGMLPLEWFEHLHIQSLMKAKMTLEDDAPKVSDAVAWLK